MALPLIIDTDPGIDDAVAIMLAAASPEVRILGITAVAGNVGLEVTSANAVALADLLELDCPVGVGAAGPLWRRDTKPATDVHGTNGLGGFELPRSRRDVEPALPLLARLITQSPDPVTIAAIGPLTNVAGLLTHHPEAVSNIGELVFMGGGTGQHLGNATPAAEFNMYYDPDAAARVLASGIPMRMVGLNVTNTALVGPHHLPELQGSRGQVAQIVQHLLTTYRSSVVDGGTAQHDSVAIASVIDPSLLTTRHLHVDVENTGRLTSGMTVIDHEGALGEPPNCHVAVVLDVERFRSLLSERLTALDTRVGLGHGAWR